MADEQKFSDFKQMVDKGLEKQGEYEEFRSKERKLMEEIKTL